MKLSLVEHLRDPRAARWLVLWTSALLAHTLIYATGFYALWPAPDEEQIVGYFLGLGLPLASSALLMLLAWVRVRRGTDLAHLAERLTAAHLSLVAVLILLAQGGTFILTEQQAALFSQQPALSVAWLILSYGLLLALSSTRLGRRGLALALSGALSLALLAILAMPIMQRSGWIDLGQGAWFEWQAADDRGCTEYRFSGQGLGAIWLGDEGLAGVNAINEGQTCAAAPLLLRVVDAQGSEKRFPVGNTATRASLAGWWEALLTGLIAPWMLLYGGALRRRYGPALEEALADTQQHRATMAFMLLGLLAFYVMHLIYLGDLMSVRSQPPEADDSYAYIWMGFRLVNCLDCEALKRLRQDILSPTDDAAIGMIRWRRDYLGSLYAPLQSALLALLRPLSTSWETTYAIYMLGGMLLAGLALELFLYNLIGPGPAGLALILLALLPWSVRMPPSTLALLIALIAWGLSWRPRLPSWAFFLLIGLLLLSHTIGRLYGLIFITLHGLNSLVSTGRLPLLKLAAGVAFVGLYWGLAVPIGIDSPLALPLSASTPYQVTALAQLHHLAGRMLSFVESSLGQVGLGLVVLGLALALLPDVLRRRWLIFALVFGPLLLASAFYVTDFLHDVVNRVLVVYRYLLVALFAFVAYGGLLLALRQRNVLIGLLASSLIVLSLAQHVRLFNSSLAPDNYAKIYQNYAFRQEGLQALLDQAEPGATILYNLPPQYDALLPYALVNGAYQHPAIFLPMLDTQQRQADEVRQACWMVAYTPGAEGRQNGILQLRYEDGLRASLVQARDLVNLRLLIPDSPRPYRLILDVDGSEYALDVPARSPGWRSFPVPAGLKAQAFTLYRQGGTGADGIMGLRFGDGPLHWAWEEGLRLEFGYVSFDGRREERALFRLEALLPPGWESGVILDDTSDLLVVQRAGC